MRRTLHTSTDSAPVDRPSSSKRPESSTRTSPSPEVPREAATALTFRTFSTSELSQAQQDEVDRLSKVSKRLAAYRANTKQTEGESDAAYLVRILQSTLHGADPQEVRSIRRLSARYGALHYNSLQRDIGIVTRYRTQSRKDADRSILRDAVARLGMTDESFHVRKVQSASARASLLARETHRRARLASKVKAVPRTKAAIVDEASALPARGALARMARKRILEAGALIPAPEDAAVINVQQIVPEPVELPTTPDVPQLSHGLGRVLFNPGVYQLQDQRSRVYNFDPSLSKIIPLKEFNFDLLNPYITSSKDGSLVRLAREHGKRYVGSTSSMTGVMSQFHYILSAWRPPNLQNMAQEPDSPRNFTTITRAPASIYLRWKNGVYAVDADKEHDTPNVLMMQGKTMEKLLTLDKTEFEQYHQSNSDRVAAELVQKPEAFHYTGMENFLLRSQLDAHDPRLPGTGMFDLKTRAVAGIRLRIKDFEDGMGYEIKGRYGAWESYEKEYADMIRAAFLKYSLQARMGRMDGIFVCFHNIARIFGFQYIPLSEMDLALHGQEDTTLGDQEFNATIRLMNDIFDLATKEFPEQSIRIMFEARDKNIPEPNGRMNIYVVPCTEEQIEQIQRVKATLHANFEDKVLRGLSPSGETPVSPEPKSKDAVEPPPTAMIAWHLNIYNEVNGRVVVRPNKFSSKDRWTVKYKLKRMDDSTAQEQYKLSKRRQTSVLGWAAEGDDDDDKYFTNKIRLLNKSGRNWRRIQDEIDAGQEPVWYRDDLPAA